MKRNLSILLLALCLPIVGAFAQNDKKQNSKHLQKISNVQTVKSPSSAAASSNKAAPIKMNFNAQADDASINPMNAQTNNRAYNVNTAAIVPKYRTCGTMDKLQEQMQQDPNLVNLMKQNEHNLQQWIATHQNQIQNGKVVVSIPTVVHVVYKAAAENISDARVQQQIDVLNKDYRKLNTDIGSVPSVWTSAAADFEIQFCLASRKPDGTATTGIERKLTTATSFGQSGDPVKHASQGGLDAWDATKYLNLWVCNLGGGLLGYAQFPTQLASSPATDGVVILYSAFGLSGTAGAPYNLGRTTTHEVGHWLNLYHTWGDDGGACNGDDLCNDVPNSADATYGAPTYPLLDACATASPGVMFMNYMDYTDDGSMYMFTNNQKARAQATLAQLRTGLATSNGCSGGTLSVTTTATPTTICKGSSATLTATPNGGSTYTYSWVSTPTGFTSTAQNPVVSPTVTTTYKVTVTSSPNTATSSVIITVNALPTASAGSNISVNQGSSTTLTASGGGTYHWSSGQNTATASVTPLTTTTYTVTVTNTAGCTATSSVVVTVIPGSGIPVANFAGTPTTIAAGGTVTFTDQSTNTPTSWSWNFGDGGTSSIQNPAHVYNAAGSYTVSLTATNSSGNNTATKNNYVTVNQGAVSGCDTTKPTSFSGACLDSITLYVPDQISPLDSGVITGQNAYKFSELAQKYKGVAGGTVSDVIVMYAKKAGTTGNTSIKIYSNNGGNPGTALGTSSTIVKSAIDTTNHGVNYNNIYHFATPVNVTNDFFVSLGIPATFTTGTNELGVWSENISCSAVDTAGYFKYGATWYSCLTGLGANIDMAIFPVICSTAPLAATASATPATICKGSSSQLDVAVSGGTSYTYSWTSSPAGFTAATQNPTVTPTITTAYTVAVASGINTVTSSVIITVNAVPTAYAGADVSITNGQSATLTATGGVIYAWSNGSTTASITVSPSATTTYTVTVTSSNGCTAFDAVIVSVTGAGIAPIANFAGIPTTITTGSTVTFTDQSTNGPTIWAWNFGDGATSTIQNPTHIYSNVGTYTVSLTASNNYGTNTATKNSYIIVTQAGTAPVANFSGTPISGTAPLTTVFTDLSTNAPANWSWNFGDGGTSSIQNPSHIYNAAGTYTVALTATNATGNNTATKQNYIIVSPAIQPGGCDSWTSEATGFTTASRGLGMINVVDVNNVWAAAYNGNGTGSSYTQEYTRTTNGGTTWTPGKINNQAAFSIANIAATSGTVAWAALFDTANGGGKIMYTSNGGTSWAQQTTAAYSAANGSWLDFVHFFDANNGVCVGDPISNNWEIYSTTNGGSTWTRVAAANVPAPSSASEYGYTDVFSAYGNNIWFGTNTGRIYKSVDKGLHWTVATTGETNISKVTFRDANNGLVINRVGNPVTAVNMRKTSNGGATWTTVTRTGNFYMSDIAPVGTSKWISVGSQFPTGTGIGSYGYSFSTDDGTTWANGNDSIQMTCVSFLDASTGWAGGFNSSATVDGAYKWTACTNTLTANAIITPTAICAGSSAQLDVAVSGGTTYSYSWSSSPAGFTSQLQSPTVTPTINTIYTVTVTSNSNTATSSAVVTVNAAPTANAGIDQSICLGNSATIAASGATTYSWTSSPAGFTSTNASNSVSPSATTTYTVVATSGTCTASDAVVVTVTPLPTANAGGDQTVCTGQPATITATGGGTYSWTSTPAGFTSTNASTSVLPTATTTYTVIVNTNGCSASDAVVIAVASSVTANAGVDLSICSGSSTSLTASGGSTYSWSDGGNTAVISVSPIATTTYTVTASSGSCSATDAVIVTVNNLPIASAGGDQTVCTGQPATITATGGGTYSWTSTPAGFTSTNASTSVSPTVTTTYTVTVNTNGCSASDAVVITIASSVTANAGIDLSICSGSSASLTAAGGSTYSWSNGDNTAVISVSPTATTTYTVTASSGSCSATDAVIVTVNNLPVANAGSDVSINNGQNTTLTATGGNNYMWSNGGNTASITITPTVTSTYSVTVTSTAGCSASDAVIVTVINTGTVPVANFIGTPTTVSVGGNVVFTDQSTNIPTAWSWNFGDGGTSVIQNPTHVYNTAGTYTVALTATNAAGSNTANKNGYIIVTQTGQITVIASAPSSICDGISVTINADATGGTTYTYAWSSNPSGFTSTIQNPTVTPSITTTYMVTATSGVNTASASVTLIVSPIPATPTISANGNTLSSSATTGNQWYFNDTAIAGATDQMYIPTQNGNYQVVTTNTSGCQSILSAQFNVTFVGITSAEFSNFNIYPNPTTGMLNVIIPENQINTVITVYSVIGEVIQKQTINNNTPHTAKINLTEYSKGLYFISIKTEKGNNTWRISLIGNK